jgi:hypothetical protein
MADRWQAKLSRPIVMRDGTNLDRGRDCAHIGTMDDRWLTWSALLFGVVIPIAFLVFAWFTLK